MLRQHRPVPAAGVPALLPAQPAQVRLVVVDRQMRVLQGGVLLQQPGGREVGHADVTLGGVGAGRDSPASSQLGDGADEDGADAAGVAVGGGGGGLRSNSSSPPPLRKPSLVSPSRTRIIVALVGRRRRGGACVGRGVQVERLLAVFERRVLARRPVRRGGAAAEQQAAVAQRLLRQRRLVVQQREQPLRIGIEQAEPERRERKDERDRTDGRARKADDAGRRGRLHARPRVAAAAAAAATLPDQEASEGR
uniref:Uncharacterized protein n=1 Tax=Anopheles merus TaxID=30066 RepID=A0A182VGS8_ANOME